MQDDACFGKSRYLRQHGIANEFLFPCGKYQYRPKLLRSLLQCHEETSSCITKSPVSEALFPKIEGSQPET